MSTEARIVLTATDQTRAGIASARAGIDSLGASAHAVTGLLAGLGVSLSVASIAAFAKNAIASASALDDMAEATGATVEGLSRIQQVARKTGQDFSTVQDGVLKLTRSLSPFSESGKAAEKAVKAIGLSIDDLRRASPDQAFELIARALNNFEDGAGKSQVAMALLGKTGAQYLPLLKELAEDQETQAAITREQAAEAEKLEKQWSALTTQAQNFATALTLNAIPALSRYLEQMSEGIRIANGFGNAIRLFGIQQSPGESGKQVTELRAEIAKLEATPSLLVPGLGKTGKLDDLRKRLEFAKLLQRQEALALGEGVYGNEARSIETPRKKQIDAVGIAAENTAKKVRAAKQVTDSYVGDVFKSATSDVDRLFEEREDQLDQYGFAGTKSYMRFLKENLAFERDAWSDLARDRADDEQDRERAAAKAAADAAAEWKRASDEIENSLTDALLRTFESGSDFAKTFVQTVKNLFNTLVLRPIISAIVQPVANATLGALGMGAAGSAAASGGGFAGGGNLLSGLGQAFGSGAGLAYLGNSVIGGSFGAGLSFGSTGVLGAIEGFGAMASTGSVAGTIGAGLGVIGAAAPYIAAALAIYSIFAKQGGGPKQEIRGGAALERTPSRYGVDANLQGVIDALNSDYSRLATGLGGAPRTDIQSMVRLARDPAGDAGTQFLGRLDIAGNAAWRRYSDSIGRTPEEESEAIKDAVTRMLVTSLRETDLIDQIDAIFDAVDPATASLQQLNDALGQAQAKMDEFAAAAGAYSAAMSSIAEAMQSTHNAYAASIREIRFGQMDVAGQYAFLDREAARNLDVLRAISDPGLIAEYSARVRESTMAAYNLLAPEQRKEVAEQFVTRLQEADRITQERLQAAADAQKQAAADIPKALIGGLEEGFVKVAEIIRAAVSRGITVDVRVDTPSLVEVGVV